MIEPFLIRAIIAGIGVAIITGAIGCFVVWRKITDNKLLKKKIKKNKER